MLMFLLITKKYFNTKLLYYNALDLIPATFPTVICFLPV